MSAASVDEASESKKAGFRRLVEIYATGDLSALDEVVAPHYAGHASAGDRAKTGSCTGSGTLSITR